MKDKWVEIKIIKEWRDLEGEIPEKLEQEDKEREARNKAKRAEVHTRRSNSRIAGAPEEEGRERGEEGIAWEKCNKFCRMQVSKPKGPSAPWWMNTDPDQGMWLKFQNTEEDKIWHLPERGNNKTKQNKTGLLQTSHNNPWVQKMTQDLQVLMKLVFNLKSCSRWRYKPAMRVWQKHWDIKNIQIFSHVAFLRKLLENEPQQNRECKPWIRRHGLTIMPQSQRTTISTHPEGILGLSI